MAQPFHLSASFGQAAECSSSKTRPGFQAREALGFRAVATETADPRSSAGVVSLVEAGPASSPWNALLGDLGKGLDSHGAQALPGKKGGKTTRPRIARQCKEILGGSPFGGTYPVFGKPSRVCTDSDTKGLFRSHVTCERDLQEGLHGLPFLYPLRLCCPLPIPLRGHHPKVMLATPQNVHFRLRYAELWGWLLDHCAVALDGNELPEKSKPLRQVRARLCLFQACWQCFLYEDMLTAKSASACLQAHVLK